VSTEENKTLVRRFNEEAFNRRDIEARDRFLGDNFAVNGEIVDPASSKKRVANLFAALPDFHRTPPWGDD
jgi:hypothetical protein